MKDDLKLLCVSFLRSEGKMAGSYSCEESPNLKERVRLNALNWGHGKRYVHGKRGEATESVSFLRLSESDIYVRRNPGSSFHSNMMEKNRSSLQH